MKGRKFNKDIVIFLFIFLIFTGKIVRYTVMKNSLVDPGIGHSMINAINAGKTSFGLTYNKAATDDIIDASDNAVHIFRMINFFGLSTYEEFEIYISIIWNVILFALILNIKKSLTPYEMLFLLASIVVLNIFDFCLAKEPIQMLYFLSMYMILLSTKKSAKLKYSMCFGIMLLSAITFRIYYVIIAMFMIIIMAIFEGYIDKVNKITIKNILYILIGLCLFYFIFLNISKYLATSEYNELIRVRLRTSSAASDMRAIFHSDNLLIFSIDYLIMIIRMLCPIELIKLGPKYLPYILYQLIITYILVKNVLDYKKIDEVRKICLFIGIAFLLGSATFEPDFGSWIRHEAVLFPILLLLMGLTKKRKIN